MFFRDGVRRIDFVLSYVDDKDGERKQVRKEDLNNVTLDFLYKKKQDAFKSVHNLDDLTLWFRLSGYFWRSQCVLADYHNKDTDKHLFSVCASNPVEEFPEKVTSPDKLAALANLLHTRSDQMSLFSRLSVPGKGGGHRSDRPVRFHISTLPQGVMECVSAVGQKIPHSFHCKKGKSKTAHAWVYSHLWSFYLINPKCRMVFQHDVPSITCY